LILINKKIENLVIKINKDVRSSDFSVKLY